MRLIKDIAKYYIWAFGLLFTHLAVLNEIVILPGQALRLIVLLYVFDAALLFLLCVDIYQKYQKYWKRQAK
jgi:hypothetical protein